MLFTTLVPVYKTHFLEDTVACPNAQTLNKFQVIFSDDSPTQDLSQLLTDLQSDSLIQFPFRVIQGPRLGPASNCHHLLTAWDHSTPYIHYLLDDDLIFPDFYQCHAQTYQRSETKTCISSRIIVNEKKTPLGTADLPDFILQKNTRDLALDLQSCIASIIPTCNNWLGELSSATFHGATLAATITGKLRHIPYYGLNDLGIFLEMLAAEPVSYINKHLGAFRINRLQTSGDSRSTIFKSTIISWASLALDARELGLSDSAAQQCLQRIALSVKNLLPENPDLAPLYGLLSPWQSQVQDWESFSLSFAQYWQGELQKNEDFLHANSPLIQRIDASSAPAPSHA